MRTEESRTEKSRTEELLALGMFGPGSWLRQRVEMLLEHGRDFSPRASRMRVAVSVVTLLACAIAGGLAPRLIAFAQDPAFDVASVRPNKTGQGPKNGRVTRTPGRLVAYAPIPYPIRAAYGIKAYQLSGGPNWLDSEIFDVEGKAGNAADNAQLNAMLRTLLAERFKLVVHRETKEMSVYNLLVGKSGVKFPEIKPGEPRPTPTLKPGAASMAYAASISILADTLALPMYLGRPVLDKTGLTGDYFINIQLGPGEELTDAVQDQGLKLESAKARLR